MTDYLADFFNKSNDLLVVADLNGRFVKVNSSWEKVTGWTAEELTSRPYVEFVHPDDRAKTATINATGVENQGQISGFENRYLTKCGHYRTFQWKASVDFDKKIYYAVARDISDLRSEHEELFQDNKRFQQILDAIDSFILLKDRDSKLLWTNKGFREFYGFKPDEDIQGITDKATADPKLTEKYLKDDLHVVNTGKKLEIPCEPCLRYDNQLRQMKVTKSPIFDEKGHVIMTIGIFQDITDKLYQEEIIRQQQAQMIHASRMSSVGEMAAGIAHEVNNPLTIINSIIFQAQTKIDKGEFSVEQLGNSFDRITKSLDRIAKIVKSLRFLSRESGNDPLTSNPLSTIFQDISALCQEKFRFAEVQLQVEDCSGLVAQCRPSEIGQVLLNLISNSFDAVKHQSKPWVKVKALSKGKRIEIEVIDSGSGIAPDVAEKMMNPFFTTKEIGMGTGLGLSIAYSIVRAHGGDLRYDTNSPNTRFVFGLPVGGLTKSEGLEPQSP